MEHRLVYNIEQSANNESIKQQVSTEMQSPKAEAAIRQEKIEQGVQQIKETQSSLESLGWRAEPVTVQLDPQATLEVDFMNYYNNVQGDNYRPLNPDESSFSTSDYTVQRLSSDSSSPQWNMVQVSSRVPFRMRVSNGSARPVQQSVSAKPQQVSTTVQQQETVSSSPLGKLEQVGSNQWRMCIRNNETINFRDPENTHADGREWWGTIDTNTTDWDNGRITRQNQSDGTSILTFNRRLPQIFYNGGRVGVTTSSPAKPQQTVQATPTKPDTTSQTSPVAEETTETTTKPKPNTEAKPTKPETNPETETEKPEQTKEQERQAAEKAKIVAARTEANGTWAKITGGVPGYTYCLKGDTLYAFKTTTGSKNFVTSLPDKAPYQWKSIASLPAGLPKPPGFVTKTKEQEIVDAAKKREPVSVLGNTVSIRTEYKEKILAAVERAEKMCVKSEIIDKGANTVSIRINGDDQLEPMSSVVAIKNSNYGKENDYLNPNLETELINTLTEVTDHMIECEWPTKESVSVLGTSVSILTKHKEEVLAAVKKAEELGVTSEYSETGGKATIRINSPKLSGGSMSSSVTYGKDDDDRNFGFEKKLIATLTRVTDYAIENRPQAEEATGTKEKQETKEKAQETALNNARNCLKEYEQIKLSENTNPSPEYRKNVQLLLANIDAATQGLIPHIEKDVANDQSILYVKLLTASSECKTYLEKHSAAEGIETKRETVRVYGVEVKTSPKVAQEIKDAMSTAAAYPKLTFSVLDIGGEKRLVGYDRNNDYVGTMVEISREFRLGQRVRDLIRAGIDREQTLEAQEKGEGSESLKTQQELRVAALKEWGDDTKPGDPRYEALFKEITSALGMDETPATHWISVLKSGDGFRTRISERGSSKDMKLVWFDSEGNVTSKLESTERDNPSTTYTTREGEKIHHISSEHFSVLQEAERRGFQILTRPGPREPISLNTVSYLKIKKNGRTLATFAPQSHTHPTRVESKAEGVRDFVNTVRKLLAKPEESFTPLTQQERIQDRRRELGVRIDKTTGKMNIGDKKFESSSPDKITLQTTIDGGMRIDDGATGKPGEGFIMVDEDGEATFVELVGKAGQEEAEAMLSQVEPQKTITEGLRQAPYSVVKDYAVYMKDGALRVYPRPRQLAMARSASVKSAPVATDNQFGGKDIFLDGGASFSDITWRQIDLRTALEEAGLDENTDLQRFASASRPVMEYTYTEPGTGAQKKGFLVLSNNPSHPSVLSICSGGVQVFDMKSRGSRIVAKKPVIYLYPEQETDIDVAVELDGMEFTSLYPKMQDEKWRVQAQPNGDLIDRTTDKPYSYLFWEAERVQPYEIDHSKAYCVADSDAESFLEETLNALGLNTKERNDFIVYWLPILEQNPYSVVQFLEEQYTEEATLHISPQPDTTIRVFMIFEASDTPVEVGTPTLPSVERRGYTAIEWGGSNLDEQRNHNHITLQ